MNASRHCAASLGLVRPGSQTQREFAATVGPRIRQVVQSPDGLPQLPPRLVEFFYRARFGNEELPAPTIEELNRDMTQLEQLLRNCCRPDCAIQAHRSPSVGFSAKKAFHAAGACAVFVNCRGSTTFA